MSSHSDQFSPKKYQRLKGTDDIFGAEAAIYHEIEARARQVFSIFNYKEIKTPIIENKQLFTHALGESTDVVQKEMYEFLDKSNEYVVLRPEGTAGIVRAYLENGLDKQEKYTKLFYTGPMFRRERPQKGRYRQFHQIGAEYLGSTSPFADADVIHVLTIILRVIGIDGYKLWINTLGTLEERSKYKLSLREYFGSQLSHLCEDCKVRYEKNVMRVLDCKNESCQRYIHQSPTIQKFLSNESLGHFELTKKMLSMLGIDFIENPRMVRGLDYYSHTVFEVTHHDLGSQDAIGAGGRYDRLVDLMGGKSKGAVGFALGMERVRIVSKYEAIQIEKPQPFVIVAFGEEALQKGFSLLGKLRSQGIPAEMDFEGRKNLSNALADIARRNVFFVAIIIREDEIAKDTVKIKDAYAGNEKEVGFEDAISEIKLIYDRLKGTISLPSYFPVKIPKVIK